MFEFITYADIQKKSNHLGMTPEQIESAKTFLQFSIEQTKQLMQNSERDINWCRMQLLLGRAELLMHKLADVKSN